MKRSEIQGYVNALNGVSEIKGVKFAFTVLKNKKKIEKQVDEDKEIIQEILTATDEFKEFEDKRLDLCKLHSNKDEDGEAIVVDEKFDLIDEKLFNKEFDALKDEYAEPISEREQQLKEFQEIMNEEISITFAKLTFEDLPTDISEKQLESIEFMIDLGE